MTYTEFGVKLDKYLLFVTIGSRGTHQYFYTAKYYMGSGPDGMVDLYLGHPHSIKIYYNIND
jgi:hypothetical protein